MIRNNNLTFRILGKITVFLNLNLLFSENIQDNNYNEKDFIGNELNMLFFKISKNKKKIC